MRCRLAYLWVLLALTVFGCSGGGGDQGHPTIAEAQIEKDAEQNDAPELSSGPTGYEKGAKEAATAIAAGNLKLREYPPLPYPPGHQEYVKLLRERCGIEYEVPKLPPGVDKTVFIQEVRGWNDVMNAEIKRTHGADIFEQLHEEARKQWQRQVNPKGQG